MNEKNNLIPETYHFKCYNCNAIIKDPDQKYCHICKIILNPNNLEWKSSFLLFICFICATPIILSILIIYLSTFF
jgi:hypothetical protein